MDDDNRPNIVLINCDDLGYGDPGCYGHPEHRTPAIDRLAEEGVLFTDFYMPSSVCSPSRGGMLTGCYPPRIGFGEFNGEWVLFPGVSVGLDPAEATIGSVLKAAGYATAQVGKWHCGDQPRFLPARHGFDFSFGLPYSNDMGRQRGRPQFPPLPLLRNGEVVAEQPDQTSLIERYVEESRRFMRRSARAGRPFFLYLAHTYVHLPLYVPEAFLRDTSSPYAAAVACIDWSTDLLLRELEKLGAAENTLVIFTSDNGSRCDFGPSNGPLRGVKGTTWEGGLRVPCIARWPRRIPASRRCRGLVSAIDLLPTLESLCGLPRGGELKRDGIDVSNLFLEPESPSPREEFFYYMRNNLEGLRRGEWKLRLESGADATRLYNLREDPGERCDRSGERPDLVADLSRRMEAMRADLGDDRLGIPGPGRREPGRTDSPRPLTVFEPDYPLLRSLYDLEEFG